MQNMAPISPKNFDSTKRVESPKKQITGQSFTRIELKLFKHESKDELKEKSGSSGHENGNDHQVAEESETGSQCKSNDHTD